MHEADFRAQQQIDEVHRNAEEGRVAARRAEIVALAQAIYIHQTCQPHEAFKRAHAFRDHIEGSYRG